MTEDQSRSMLLALGFPEAVFTIWEGHDASPLALSWSKPRFGVEQELERHVPGLSGLCPIFEVNGEAVIGCLPNGSFIRFYYEDGLLGDEGVEVLGENYQQFVGRLLLDLEEAGLREESTLAAAVFGFDHTSELTALLDAEPYNHQLVEEFVVQLANAPGDGWAPITERAV